jgi:hypothetical protein
MKENERNKGRKEIKERINEMWASTRGPKIYGMKENERNKGRKEMKERINEMRTTTRGPKIYGMKENERKRGRKEINEGRIKERINEMWTITNNRALQGPVNTAMQEHIHTAADATASHMHISNPHMIRRSRDAAAIQTI